MLDFISNIIAKVFIKRLIVMILVALGIAAGPAGWIVAIICFYFSAKKGMEVISQMVSVMVLFLVINAIYKNAYNYFKSSNNNYEQSFAVHNEPKSIEIVKVDKKITIENNKDLIIQVDKPVTANYLKAPSKEEVFKEIYSSEKIIENPVNQTFFFKFPIILASKEFFNSNNEAEKIFIGMRIHSDEKDGGWYFYNQPALDFFLYKKNNAGYWFKAIEKRGFVKGASNLQPKKEISDIRRVSISPNKYIYSFFVDSGYVAPTTVYSILIDNGLYIQADSSNVRQEVKWDFSTFNKDSVSYLLVSNAVQDGKQYFEVKRILSTEESQYGFLDTICSQWVNSDNEIIIHDKSSGTCESKGFTNILFRDF